MAETNEIKTVEKKVVEPIIVEGPTIFKSSNTSKIVLISVSTLAVGYGIYKGVKCIIKKKKSNYENSLTNSLEADEVVEEVTEAE